MYINVLGVAFSQRSELRDFVHVIKILSGCAAVLHKQWQYSFFGNEVPGTRPIARIYLGGGGVGVSGTQKSGLSGPNPRTKTLFLTHYVDLMDQKVVLTPQKRHTFTTFCNKKVDRLANLGGGCRTPWLRACLELYVIDIFHGTVFYNKMVGCLLDQDMAGII